MAGAIDEMIQSGAVEQCPQCGQIRLTQQSMQQLSGEGGGGAPGGAPPGGGGAPGGMPGGGAPPGQPTFRSGGKIKRPNKR